jgi:branched-chain amino acid transport system ATP-binding protein
MSSLLTLEGVDVFYGPVQALRGVSLEVGEGELVALLGPNGAGKSTTVRAVTGITRVRRGTITFDGRRLDTMPAPAIVSSGVVQVPEGRRVFASLTVQENLLAGGYTVKDRRALAAGIDLVLETFPRLAERQNQRAGSLSGGEQQMLAIGRALVSSPRLLLIDEMSLGLAPIVVTSLFELLVDITARGVTVVLVEQFANLALKVADRGYVLEKGHVSVSGSAAELLRDTAVLPASYMGDGARA